VVISASYQLYDTDLWSCSRWAARSTDPVSAGSTSGPGLVRPAGVRVVVGVPRPDLATVAAGGLWGSSSGWLTTLGVFALLFATARRLGARGVSAVL